MKNVKLFAFRFTKDESGQNLVEYALVVVLIALAAITAMGSLGNGVTAAFSKIGTSLNSAI